MIFDTSHKDFMGANPLRIKFDKIDRFIKSYDGIRYLVSYDYKRYNAIYDRIRYFVSGKSGITGSINHNFARISIDSYNILPIEKILTFYNAMILINPVVDKNKKEH